MTDEQIKRMIVENRGNEEDLFADIKELTKKAEVRGQLKAYLHLTRHEMIKKTYTIQANITIKNLEAELQPEATHKEGE